MGPKIEYLRGPGSSAEGGWDVRQLRAWAAELGVDGVESRL